MKNSVPKLQPAIFGVTSCAEQCANTSREENQSEWIRNERLCSSRFLSARKLITFSSISDVSTVYGDRKIDP